MTKLGFFFFLFFLVGPTKNSLVFSLLKFVSIRKLHAAQFYFHSFFFSSFISLSVRLQQYSLYLLFFIICLVATYSKGNKNGFWFYF